MRGNSVGGHSVGGHSMRGNSVIIKIYKEVARALIVKNMSPFNQPIT